MTWSTQAVIGVMALIFSLVANATGCGEPFSSASDSCTDWQCTRIVSTNLTTTTNSSFVSKSYCVRGLARGEPCRVDADCYRALTCNQTTRHCDKASGALTKPWLGYIGIAVAVLCFGSNYIPVKHVEMGNGMFFQFIMAVGILIPGLITQVARGNTTFYPYAMLGGMMWAIGNLLSVPIIHFIGMGLGVTIWGSTNMLMGWASGHFGIWGVKQEAEEHVMLAYIGLVIALVAIVAFSQVKPTTSGSKDAHDSKKDHHHQHRLNNLSMSDESSPLANTSIVFSSLYPVTSDQATSHGGAGKSRASQLGSTTKRVLGVVGSLGAGCLYGINFDPPQSLMDHYSQKTLQSDDTKYSPNGLDYVFSHYMGIFLTASTALIIYSGVRKWTPTMFPDVDHAAIIIPAFISGVMWAIADIAWFVANTNVGLVVSFPTTTMGPSVIASLWGVLVFGEIRGRRNYLLLIGAFLLVGGSCTCTILAKGNASS